MPPVYRRRLDRAFLVVALAVAVAPAVVALPPLLRADHSDWVISMASMSGASWLVATAFAGRKRGALFARMVLGSFVLVCLQLMWMVGIDFVHDVMVGWIKWSQVLSLDRLTRLSVALGLCLMMGTLITSLFGTWLLLPLYPWMLVRERMRSLPTEDAPEAMLLVSGVGAVVESVVLGVLRWHLLWMMGLTAAVGLAAVAWAVMRWRRSLHALSSYSALEAAGLHVEKQFPLRLSDSDDPSDYDILLESAQLATYRHEPSAAALAVPRGAAFTLATVLRSWLSPIDGRRIRVLAVLNALWFAIVVVLNYLAQVTRGE